jgi:hypothetical protein
MADSGRTPVFFNGEIIAEAKLSIEDDLIVIRVDKHMPLLKELMKAELAVFDINILPNTRN